ncbi:dynein regulatory complex protein 9 isoform X2 [Microcaecilia unicolor]|nr:dynein regulatory complex protein 9 isoform X2 [Microcaecilia unicolor]XP_030071733.1 dynein regulatory complex protein 9 isoform X2 [Microcaecilia unicolor]XP_030071735.1 dynein regulatory complex protein 9 isoform X2 [Microcaecilia unicolor]
MMSQAMEGLSLLDVLRINTVLEDSLDQLSILGYIMPVSYQDRLDASNVVGCEINKILKNQKQLESKFEKLMSSRAEIRSSVPVDSEKLTELEQQLHETSGDLRRANYLFSKTAKQSPLTSDNLKKVQADRQFVTEVIAETVQDLKTSGTFQSLLKAVEGEKEQRENVHATIAREEEGRKQIKFLQKQLQDVKREKEVEIQHRNELIAHLKDQLQEMKAKTSMEGKYTKTDMDLQVYQTQKKCNYAESELEQNILRLKLKMDEEVRVHMEIENFLRRQQRELEEKLEHWMEKYDKDTEAKQQELNDLKSAQFSDQQRLQGLAKQYRDYERAVIQDRIQKQEEKQRRRQDKLELKSVVKIQAWWKGTMVRKELGSFKLPKKGKITPQKGKKAAGKKKK